MTDPYSLLGVDRNASDDEVKKAYRRLSRKYHPDANINNPHKEEAEAKFKEVQQAYQQIMDEREPVMVLTAGSADTVPLAAGVMISTGEASTVRRQKKMSICALRQIISAAGIIRKRSMCWTGSGTGVLSGIFTAHRQIQVSAIM